MTCQRSPLLVLTSLALLLPVNIVGTTDFVMCGIQWGLVRYTHEAGGDQLLSFSSELYSVVTGTLTSGNAPAAILWGTGVIILLAALFINIVSLWQMTGTWSRRAGAVTIAAGFCFLVADIARYGPLFSGPAGWCIPLGIPAIFILGIWGWRQSFEDPGVREPTLPGTAGKKIRTPGSARAGLIGTISDPEIQSLVLVLIIVAPVVFFSGLLPNISFTAITGDITLYHWYAGSLFMGKIPYASYYVPYPQLFFVPVLVALVPVIGLENPVWYLLSFSALMLVVTIATLILVYSLAAKLFGKDRAFLCGLLYATAVGALYFVPITYDAFPTFLLVLSIWLFLYRGTLASYLAAAAGALAKWFPAVVFPYTILYTIKNQRDTRSLAKPLLISVVLAAAVMLPFMILNMAGFLQTYQSHTSRPPEIHSLVYYLDSVSSFTVNISPFTTWSLVILVVAELGLLWWYYRYLDNRPLTLVYVLFLALLVFVLTNKVFSACYLIWLVPFMALVLAKSAKRVALFFLAQGVIYLETPVLYGIVYAPFTFGADPKLFYTVLDNGLPSLSFVFYTVKFLIFFAILWVAVRDLREMAHDPASHGSDGLREKP
ncbi:MAG: hypothetical protein WC342_00090 [Methanoregula sp.]|jgi:hypothetical protein